MPDLSLIPDRADAESENEARIEQLLLAGLDFYFAGQLEQAINVWTRVSFLERGHGRARAYVERARSAIAERQREGDELLQRGIEAFNRGEIDRARDLLTWAVERSGHDDVASTVLERVHRLRLPRLSGEAGLGLADRVIREQVGAAPAVRPSRRVSLVAVTVAAGLAGALTAGVAIEVWFAAPAGSVRPPTVSRDMKLQVPTAGEVAVARARGLAAGGHVPDALRALNSVSTVDTAHDEANQLRAVLQERLLRLAGFSTMVTGDRR
jgi:hypothetical protein